VQTLEITTEGEIYAEKGRFGSDGAFFEFGEEYETTSVTYTI
jgi:hypothetical protein